jgi:hypothetical protein
MSVELIPILIDEQVLTREVARLRAELPQETLDSWETQFHAALFYEPHSERNQYAYATLRPFRSIRMNYDADAMRFQLLDQARKTARDAGPTERSASALFHFLEVFFCCFVGTNPHNEFGFQHSTIISLSNCRRLHALFERIDFALLAPVFAEHCKTRDDGSAYTRIDSFAELVEYATALDGLLVQAMDSGKWLYIYAG